MKNNKGFAISSIMYLMLVMALIVVALILAILGSRKMILDSQKNKLIKSIELSQIESMYSVTFETSGSTQKYNIPRSGYYKIELWGSGTSENKGSYTSGIIELSRDTELFLYIGSQSLSYNDSDVRVSDGRTSLNNVLMMAAGSSDKYANDDCKGSFVSGYIGCNSVTTGTAIYSNTYIFSNPIIYSPGEDMPSYINNSTITGNNGDGFAKITFISPTTVASNFDYTGSVQTFSAPESGYYKLEVWGAQGGYALCSKKSYPEDSACAIGGYGGYSTGVVYLEKNEKIYIYVGGQGSNGLYQENSLGGYNGGGIGTWDGGDDEAAGGGGGATHIATVSGQLPTLSSAFDQGKILIIAGGGGGGSWHNQGGSGGGIEGGAPGQGAKSTQTTGAGFGQGANAQGAGTSNGHGGGGGGLQGGLESTASSGDIDEGGGGSGYIGNSLLSNKYMTCYNCTTSDELNTKTNSVNVSSDDPISDTPKAGNGYAKINLILEGEPIETLQYIKSNGYQYIDTEYVPTTTTKVELELKFEGTYNPQDSNNAFFGVTDNTNAFAMNFGGNPNQYNQIFNWVDKAYDNGGAVKNLTGISNDILNSRNIITFKSNLMKYSTLSKTLVPKTQNQTKSMILFGERYIDNTCVGDCINLFGAYDMYLYSFKVYEGDTLVRSYVPARRRIDDSIGLYETIEKKFYENSGTKNFLYE